MASCKLFLLLVFTVWTTGSIGQFTSLLDELNIQYNNSVSLNRTDENLTGSLQIRFEFANESPILEDAISQFLNVSAFNSSAENVANMSSVLHELDEQCFNRSMHCVIVTDSKMRCDCVDNFKVEISSNNEALQVKFEYIDVKTQNWHSIFQLLKSVEGSSHLLKQLIRKVYLTTVSLQTSGRIEPEDVYKLSVIFETLAARQGHQMLLLLLPEESIEAVFKTIDILISSEKVLKEANLRFANSSLKLVKSIDELTRMFGLSSGQTVSFELENLNVLVVDAPLTAPGFPYLLETSLTTPILDSRRKSLLIDSITLNEAVLKQKYNNNSIKIAFKIYFNAKLTPGRDWTEQSHMFDEAKQRPKNFFFDLVENSDETGADLFNSFITSNILSAVIYEKNNNSRHATVKSSHEKFVRTQFIVDLSILQDPKLHKHLKCVYWDFGVQQWLQDGCHASADESTELENSQFYRKVCYCNHLTHFAVLFDPLVFTKRERISAGAHAAFKRVLSLVSLVGVLVSSLCYATMIVARLSVSGQTGSDHRDASLKRLYLANAICLLCGNIFFLSISFVKPSDNLLICQLSGALLHFFLLAAFCFSLGTAWQHFSKLVRVFKSRLDKPYCQFRCLTIGALLIPLALSICGYVIEQRNSYYFLIYEPNCWLKPPHLYHLFVIPISLLLGMSLYFYVFVCIKVRQIYNTSPGMLATNERLRSRLNSSYNQKRVIVLLTFSFISLGLTWLVGILIVISAQLDEYLKLLMELLFCVLNSFHGLSLMVAHLLAHRFSEPAADGPAIASLGTRAYLCFLFYRMFYCLSPDKSRKQSSNPATFELTITNCPKDDSNISSF